VKRSPDVQGEKSRHRRVPPDSEFAVIRYSDTANFVANRSFANKEPTALHDCHRAVTVPLKKSMALRHEGGEQEPGCGCVLTGDGVQGTAPSNLSFTLCCFAAPRIRGRFLSFALTSRKPKQEPAIFQSKVEIP